MKRKKSNTLIEDYERAELIISKIISKERNDIKSLSYYMNLNKISSGYPYYFIEDSSYNKAS